MNAAGIKVDINSQIPVLPWCRWKRSVSAARALAGTWLVAQGACFSCSIRAGQTSTPLVHTHLYSVFHTHRSFIHCVCVCVCVPCAHATDKYLIRSERNREMLDPDRTRTLLLFGKPDVMSTDFTAECY